MLTFSKTKQPHNWVPRGNVKLIEPRSNSASTPIRCSSLRGREKAFTYSQNVRFQIDRVPHFAFPQRNRWQDGQLPGRCQFARGVHGRRRCSKLAALSAGELGERSAKARRSRCPEEVKFQKKWELALEMIDQARAWELTDRIIVAMRLWRRDRVSRRVGEAQLRMQWECSPTREFGLSAATAQIENRSRPGVRQACRTMVSSGFGAQGSCTAGPGWKKVRWRERQQRSASVSFSGRPGCSLPTEFHEAANPGKEI